MKLEIEVPDGLIAGKLVYLETRQEGMWLGCLDVSTGRVIQAGKLDMVGKREKQCVPWEAD